MNRAQRRAARADKAPKVDTVVVGIVHPGNISAATMFSLWRLDRYEFRRTGAQLGMIERRARTMHVAFARDQIVQTFLEGSADWLLMLDADMGVPEWLLHRLLGAADKTERPIVGGLCFAMRTVDWDTETQAEIYEYFPTVSMWNRNDDGTILGYYPVEDYPKDTVCHVGSTGAACVLVHRTAFEKIGKDWFVPLEIPEGAPGLEGRGLFGEDISFFIRCDQNDIPVWVDTAAKTSHDKGGVFLTEQLYDQQQARKRALETMLAEKEGVSNAS